MVNSALTADYTDSRILDEYAEALRVIPGGSNMDAWRISAASDFAPIRERTSRQRPGNAEALRSVDRGIPEGIAYHIVRWPLLCIVMSFIVLDFCLYLGTRQLVNAIEWLTSLRGRSLALRKQLRSAKTYDEWKRAAAALDDYRHYSVWKEHDASALYDFKLVERVIAALQGAGGAVFTLTHKWRGARRMPRRSWE